MRRLGPAVCLLLTWLLVGAIRADEDAGALSAAVERAQEAHAAEDPAALADLAGAAEPGAWILVERLLTLDLPDVARAVAAATQGHDAEALVRYAARHRDAPASSESWASWAAIRACLESGRPKRCLLMLRGARYPPESVLEVLFGELEGELHDRLRKHAAGADAWLRAAGAAEMIGWRTRACAALQKSAYDAYLVPDYLAARGAFERRLRLVSGMGLKRQAANTLSNLGSVAGEQSDHVAAVSYFERALRIQRELDDDRSQGQTLANLGLLSTRLGRFADALRHLAHARDLLEKLDPAAPLELSYVLQRLGEVRTRLGQYDAARDLHQQAFDLATGAKPDSSDARRLAAEALGNLAIAERELGMPGEAAEHLEKALEIFGELNDVLSTAICLEQQAELAADAGAIDRALVDLRAAAELFEDVGMPLHALQAQARMACVGMEAGRPDEEEIERVLARATRLRADGVVAQIEGGLAEMHLAAGRYDEAVEHARVAAVSIQGPLAGLADSESLAARACRARCFEVGAVAACRADDLPAVFEFVERGRAGALLETLGGREALRSVVIPKDLREREDEARASEAQAVAAWREARATGHRPTIRRAEDLLEEAQRRRIQTHEQIERECKAGARLVWPEPESIGAVRELLGPNDVMVLYALHAEQSFCIVLQSEAAHLRPLEASQSDIETAVKAAFPSNPKPGEIGDVARLRRLVVDPLELPKTMKRLTIAPSGILTRMPFAMLLEGVDVAFVPSATTFVMQRELEAERGDGVLAVGVGESPARVPGTPLLGPLDMAGEEADAIGDDVLVDDEATESALRGELVRAEGRLRALHFACHCVVNERNPCLSALVLHPSLTDDGLLTALDFFDLRIDADLVSLSACSTARGTVVRGEGLVSLVRAATFGGASQVLASLWKVDDEATHELMTKFYEYWNGDSGDARSVGEALRKAQADVRGRERWEDPYYWAPWVVWGVADDVR